MVRIIGFLIGLGFVFALALGLGSTVYGLVTDPPAETAEHEFHKYPKPLELASNGPFGKFDRQQLQRGFQVYKEVCAACHSINRVAFRDLADLGYNEAEIKKIAADWATPAPSINPETGEPATRPNTPADKFPLVYPNDVTARAANNNAIPPDLSLMTKARHDGAAYVYSLLIGYVDQAGYKNEKGEELLKRFPDARTPEGLHFNPYFPTLNLAMTPPLVSDGQVTYADGTTATVDQMAKDVAAFMVWTAEPKLEQRHAWGGATLVFLLIFCGLAYGAYLNVWRGVKH